MAVGAFETRLMWRFWVLEGLVGIGLKHESTQMKGADFTRTRVRRRGLVARLFPERQLIFRSDGRVKCLPFTSRIQVTLSLIALGFAGWFGFSIYSQMEFDRALVAKERDIRVLAAVKDKEIVTLNRAYGALKSELTKSESRFGTLARTLEAKHAYLMALLDRRTTSGGALPSAAVGRSEGDTTRQRIESSRKALLVQLGALELVLEREGQMDSTAGQAIPPAGKAPSLGDSDLVRMKRERERLVARVKKLEKRFLAVNKSQRGVMDYFAAQSIDDFDRAKKLVAISGLDVDSLLLKIDDGIRRGQGGPFISAGNEAAKATVVPAALGVIDNQLDRWEKLGRLIELLPLIAPTDHYFIASKFGKRRDPINRRWAMHYGLDMAGIHRSPVRATAPGIVVKTGWSGNYGRIVEIDHGLGIRTRYGHLRRILVKRGQKVGFRQKIGQMGSSGRSTGTHVHYEILVNSKPHDPAKFMQAGKHVLKRN
jgi:hypothetical protein